MITKIKVDGKEHMAIVFDGSPDMDEVVRCKIALCDILGQMLAYDEHNLVSNDTFAYCNTLLMQMQTPPELMSDFYRTYWGKDGGTPKTARVKPCEIYE